MYFLIRTLLFSRKQCLVSQKFAEEMFLQRRPNPSFILAIGGSIITPFSWISKRIIKIDCKTDLAAFVVAKIFQDCELVFTFFIYFSVYCLFTCLCVLRGVGVNTCVFVCVYVGGCVCVCMWVCMYTCMYVCMYGYMSEGRWLWTDVGLWL